MIEPKTYRGIMVSSTFSDLKEHRRDVIEAIENFDFRAKVMKTSGAQADTDVIDTSMDMVRDSAAFIGVISHRYGQTRVPTAIRTPCQFRSWNSTKRRAWSVRSCFSLWAISIL